MKFKISILGVLLLVLYSCVSTSALYKDGYSSVKIQLLKNQPQGSNESRISGRIKDCPNKTVIPFVKILLLGKDTLETICDLNGDFLMIIPPGTYRIKLVYQFLPELTTKEFEFLPGRVYSINACFGGPCEVC